MADDFRQFLEDQQDSFGESVDDADVLDGLESNSGETESQYRGTRPGTDEILQRLESTDPEAASSLRAMQQKMSRTINETTALQKDVLTIREQLLAMREGNVDGAQQAPSGPQLPAGVTEDHLAMFQAMAEHFGYIPRAELQQQEVERTAESYVNDSLRQGVEEFGESFGTVDDRGNVLVHPEVAERLNARLAQLQDPTKGITPRDLYLLEFGTPAQRQQAQQRTSAVPNRVNRPGVVARRSTGGGTRVQIYDPKRGDTADDVFARAWAVGKRQLSQ